MAYTTAAAAPIFRERCPDLLNLRVLECNKVWTINRTLSISPCRWSWTPLLPVLSPPSVHSHTLLLASDYITRIIASHTPDVGRCGNKIPQIEGDTEEEEEEPSWNTSLRITGNSLVDRIGDCTCQLAEGSWWLKGRLICCCCCFYSSMRWRTGRIIDGGELWLLIYYY